MLMSYATTSKNINNDWLIGNWPPIDTACTNYQEAANTDETHNLSTYKYWQVVVRLYIVNISRHWPRRAVVMWCGRQIKQFKHWFTVNRFVRLPTDTSADKFALATHTPKHTCFMFIRIRQIHFNYTFLRRLIIKSLNVLYINSFTINYLRDTKSR